MLTHSQFFIQGGFFVPHNKIYQFTGEKSASFLHGQLTNNIKQLDPFQSNINLLLTNKGKLVSELHIIRTDSHFLALVNQHQHMAVSSRGFPRLCGTRSIGWNTIFWGAGQLTRNGHGLPPEPARGLLGYPDLRIENCRMAQGWCPINWVGLSS